MTGCDPVISIHTLLAESDVNIPANLKTKGISIHTLLAESDNMSYQLIVHREDFNPHPPRGE